jgi:hypothetical protein
MLALLERDPDLYLDEITSELHRQHGINASISAVWQTMAALGLRRKKVWASALHFHICSNVMFSCLSPQENDAMSNDNIMQRWLVWRIPGVSSSLTKPLLTYG